MKRYLTLMLAAAIILQPAISGCSDFKGLPRLMSAQQREDKGQLPEAEAAHEDVLAPGKGAVLGFYTDAGQAARDSLVKNIKALDEAAFFWYAFDGTGKVKPAGNVDLSLKEAAQKGGVKAYALVHNLNGEEFDSQLAHQVLANQAVRGEFIKNLLALTIQENWDGLTIDIEKILAGDRSSYSAFLAELHTALKAKGKILSVSIAAKYRDDPEDLWSGAFDYAEIGKAADQVVLMTYEEHGVGTTQGPIASLGWVKRVIDFAKGQIPEEKIVMGLGVYASNWASDKPIQPTYLTYAKAVELARQNNVSILYDETQQVPHFAFTNGEIRHEVYLENARSLSAKLDVAKKNQLQGVAIWRLGIEDASLWSDVLKDYASK